MNDWYKIHQAKQRLEKQEDNLKRIEEGEQYFLSGMAIQRAKRRMQLNELASLTGISKGFLAAIEDGYRPITKANARAIARVLRCRFEDLL